MAFKGLDGDGNPIYFKSNQAGTELEPIESSIELSDTDRGAISLIAKELTLSVIADLITALTEIVNNLNPLTEPQLRDNAVLVELSSLQVTDLQTSVGYTSGLITVSSEANATPYIAGDCYCARGQLPDTFGTIGKAYIITDITVVFNLSSIPTGWGSFELYLFSSEPTTLVDKGIFALYADPSCLTPNGIILNTPVLKANSTNRISVTDLLTITRVKTTNNLWFALVTTVGFIPASSIVRTAGVTIRGLG